MTLPLTPSMSPHLSSSSLSWGQALNLRIPWRFFSHYGLLWTGSVFHLSFCLLITTEAVTFQWPLGQLPSLTGRVPAPSSLQRRGSREYLKFLKNWKGEGTKIRHVHCLQKAQEPKGRSQHKAVFVTTWDYPNNQNLSCLQGNEILVTRGVQKELHNFTSKWIEGILKERIWLDNSKFFQPRFYH